MNASFGCSATNLYRFRRCNSLIVLLSVVFHLYAPAVLFLLPLIYYFMTDLVDLGDWRFS